MSSCSLIDIANSINQFRITHSLRILWPDYEILDLLSEGMTLEQIGHFASHSPLVVRYRNQENTYAFPLDSPQFTHLAVWTRKEMNQQFQSVNCIYLVLTHRGIAVDQINFKYARQKYILTAHVYQLNRQHSLWGVQTLAGKVCIWGPKYIHKKKLEWLVEIESEQPITSLLFYSTKRNPSYGMNYYYGGELPKDVQLQFCMKYKTFASYMIKQMSKEQPLIDNINSLPFSNKKDKICFIPAGSIPKQQNSKQQKPRQKLEQSQVKRTSCGVDRDRLVTMVLLENQSQMIEQGEQIKESLGDMNHKLETLKSEFYSKLINQQQDLDQQMRLKISNYQTQIQQFASLNSWQQYQKLEAIKQTDINIIFNYYYAEIINGYCINPTNRQLWLSYYKISQLVKHQELRMVCRQILTRLLIQNCGQLLKDSDGDVKMFNQLTQFSLFDCLVQGLQLYQHNYLIISDLLFILMTLEEQQNIIQLYNNYRLVHSSVVICKSVSNWLTEMKLPSASNSDILYKTTKTLDFIAYNTQDERSISIRSNQPQFSIHFQIDKFSSNCILSCKRYKIGQNYYQIYLFRNDCKFYCLVEETYSLNQEQTQSCFHSFDIEIQLTVNSQLFCHSFGWSFINFQPTIGHCFEIKCQETVDIDCIIRFKRNIVHQSVLNYFRIRFANLLKLPNQTQNDSRQSNRKLQKRRSSFLLQKNWIDLNFAEHLQQKCFFHRQCQLCESMHRSLSIYQLNPIDMYLLLLSTPFTTETNALLSVFKFICSQQQQFKNSNFLLSQIRIDYLSCKCLLQLFNTHGIKSQMRKMMSSIIEMKLKNIISIQQPHEYNTINIVNKPRQSKQFWLNYEQDYSADYLPYMMNDH